MSAESEAMLKEARELRSKSDRLFEKARLIACDELLKKLGWQIGDDLERLDYNKDVVRVQIVALRDEYSLMVRRYKKDGQLYAKTVVEYPSSNWKKVEKK